MRRPGLVAAAVALGALLCVPALAGEKFTLPLNEVEVADEQAERARGMMGRRELCDTCGMLFIWADEQVRSFWMRNTLIPLDLIFLSSGGEVVSVVTGMEPLRERPPYGSARPARFALETPVGYVERNGVREGMRIDLEALFEAAVPYRWPED